MSTQLPKRLAAFDFDYTIVDDNTDTVVRALLPKSEFDLYSDKKWKCWTYYMQDIFSKLHKNNIPEKSITDAIATIPPVDGMLKLLQTLHNKLNFDVIIISDSNVYFIETWLKVMGLRDTVQVFSNPARFHEGRLEITPYHEQTECKLSAYNMCKGRILKEFVEAQRKRGIEYDQKYFTGDGKNDFCPIKSLESNDVGCVRKEFKCLEMLKTEYVDAEIFAWRDGNDLLEFMENKFLS